MAGTPVARVTCAVSYCDRPAVAVLYALHDQSVLIRSDHLDRPEMDATFTAARCADCLASDVAERFSTGACEWARLNVTRSSEIASSVAGC